jgi:lactoylglutathione lyase
MKSRIRHIAIIVPDAEEAARFYEKAFGFTRAGRARRGIYMTDGVVNVALLTKEHENEKLGLYHFGVWVDDLDDAEKHVVEAGGSYLAGRRPRPIRSTRRNIAIPTAWCSTPTTAGPAQQKTSSSPTPSAETLLPAMRALPLPVTRGEVAVPGL